MGWPRAHFLFCYLLIAILTTTRTNATELGNPSSEIIVRCKYRAHIVLKIVSRDVAAVLDTFSNKNTYSTCKVPKYKTSQYDLTHHLICWHLEQFWHLEQLSFDNHKYKVFIIGVRHSTQLVNQRNVLWQALLIVIIVYINNMTESFCQECKATHHLVLVEILNSGIFVISV